jgi:hypothetical protein
MFMAASKGKKLQEMSLSLKKDIQEIATSIDIK